MKALHDRAAAAKLFSIVLSTLLMVFGAVMAVFNSISLRTVGIIAGILMILFGVIRVIGYFSNDLYRLAYQHDLALGILLTLLGIIFLCRSALSAETGYAFLGIAVAADALLKVQTAIDAKRFGVEHWWAILLPALLTAAAGTLVILLPAGCLPGLCVFLDGLLNLITVLISVKIIRKEAHA